MRILPPLLVSTMLTTASAHAGTASWTVETDSAKPDCTWKHCVRYDIRHPQ